MKDCSNVHTCTCICQYVLMNEYKISKKAMSFHLRIGINFIQNSCNIYLPGNIPKKNGLIDFKGNIDNSSKF